MKFRCFPCLTSLLGVFLLAYSSCFSGATVAAEQPGTHGADVASKNGGTKNLHGAKRPAIKKVSRSEPRSQRSSTSRTSASPVSQALGQTDNRNLDNRFLLAREAVRRGDRTTLARLVPELNEHELAIYFDFWRLQQTSGEGSDLAVPLAFIYRHEGDFLAERLRADLLRELTKQGMWDNVIREFARLQAPEQEAQCLVLNARLQRADNTVLPALLKLWNEPTEANEICQPLLERFARTSSLSADDVWRRAHLQLELNRISSLRRTLAFLPDDALPSNRQLDLALDRPLVWLGQVSEQQLASPAQRQVLLLALQRIARNDPVYAAGQLRNFESALSRDERARGWSHIAFQGAKRLLPEAVDWYKTTTPAVLSEENMQWKVRSALRAKDWGMVRETITAMPAGLAARPEWIYWMGRAYKAEGRMREAEPLFARITGQAHFYGNLADEELGHRISVPPLAKPPTHEERTAVIERQGIRRALAWFRLDMRTEGVKEWNWALRGMSDRELLAAAHLAREYGIYDRAIMAADKTLREHDFSLRYLSPFSDEVRAASRKQAVDDAWVYGLMRQESRFITGARSQVGASGLMQLMPATARWVAKKIGLKNFHFGKVTDTSTNLLLGTTYMRLVLENLDNHPVLASAAYNAGPGRARKWRGDTPLEGAVYAESIPFQETRDYVKKVMSNSVYYAALFNGRSESLRERLGMIPANGASPLNDPDLP